jgi:hypothetical protein
MKKLGYIKRLDRCYLIEQNKDQYYATPVRVVFEVEEKWKKKDPADKYTSYILTNKEEVEKSAKEIKLKERIPLELNNGVYGYFFTNRFNERLFQRVFRPDEELTKECYRREICTEMIPAYGLPI